ncbi:MAG: MFS transporter [Thermoproteota archaeon]
MEKWLIITLLFYAVSSGVSVFIPIYILTLHGNAVDVATSIAIFSITNIFFSLVAGILTEKIFNPKLWIILSAITTTLVLVFLLFAKSVYEVVFSYALLSLTLTLPSPSLNLYVINSALRKIGRVFGKYSLIGSIGSVIGLFLGIKYISPFIYDLLLIITSLIIVLVALKIEKLNNLVKIRKEHKKHFSLLNSLSYLPYILTGIDIIKKGEARLRKINWLMWASALFISGIYLFNAPYIPFLTKNKIGNSEIFLINLLGSLTSLIVYYFVSKGRFLRAGVTYRNSLIIRAIAYLLVFISAFLSLDVLYFNEIGYALVGISYALWNVSISIAIYKAIRNEYTAFILGLWSAINAISAAVSSEIAGFLYSVIGFAFIPLIAFAIMLLSYICFQKGIAIKQKERA